VLMASAKSNVGKLAGAIAAQIRTHGVAVVSAVGPQASYMVLKATIIADKYLQDTLSGKRLAVVPKKNDITGEEAGGTDTVGLHLHIRPLPEVEPAVQPDIFSSGNTNVGLMAGLMSNMLKKADVVTLGGMGANAVSSALKATIIAQGFMADTLGETSVLAIVPRMNEFDEGGEKRSRMLLACTRTES